MSDGRSPAGGRSRRAAHGGRRSRRPARLVALAAGVVLVVVLALVAWASLARQGAGSGEVRASSTAPGFSAASLLDASPGAGWRSTDSDEEPSVELRLRGAREVDRIRITAPAAGSLLRRGHVRFADGSAVAFAARPADREVVVRFATRRTDGFTVVADARGAGSSHVQYSRIAWDRVAGAPAARPGPPASVTASSDGSALARGSATGDLGTWSPADGDQDPSVRLRWDAPREVRLLTARGQPGSAPFTARATFSDGTTIDLGVVTPGKPTTTAFMARVTESVTVTAVQGRLSLAVLSASPRDDGTARPSGGLVTGAAPACPAGDPSPGSTRLTILCPTPGTAVDGPGFRIRVRTAPGRTVTARAYLPALRRVEQVAAASADGGGLVDLTVDPSRLLRGPLNLRVSSGPSDSAVVQVLNRSGVDAVERDTRPSGLQEVYSDAFDAPVSVSADGGTARYAAAKPSADGATQFGDAPFGDPVEHPDRVAAVPGGWLRLQLSRVPEGGRSQLEGAMVSSYSAGGSGFSALDGYFEARILGGPGTGAWPAFWMLSASSAYRPRTPVSEVDAVELYGRAPRSACHSTHNYRPGKDDDADVACADLPDADDDWALRWHTYATRITANEAVFLVDGQVVRRARRTVAADQPMFFMLNLAAGGGWPVDLSSTSGTSQMYVDWVRVSV